MTQTDLGHSDRLQRQQEVVDVVGVAEVKSSRLKTNAKNRQTLHPLVSKLLCSCESHLEARLVAVVDFLQRNMFRTHEVRELREEDAVAQSLLQLGRGWELLVDAGFHPPADDRKLRFTKGFQGL